MLLIALKTSRPAAKRRNVGDVADCLKTSRPSYSTGRAG